jgi:hypothetical protein
MKNLLKIMAVFATVLGLLTSAAVAQNSCQTDAFSITQNGDDNLSFAQYSSLPFGATFTLTVTAVQISGTFEGTSPTPVDPRATFTDVVSLSNINYPPANLTETDNYVGSAPLAQNVPAPFSSSSFTPLPNSSFSTITINLPNADLANLTGNGTFDLDVSSLLNASTIGVNIPNSTYTVEGTLMVCALPEPSSWTLGLIVMALLILLRWRVRSIPE